MTKYQKTVILILRLAMGGLFLYSGVNKVMNDFTAASYLTHATSGPLADFFASFAGNPAIDALVVYGEVLIGLALIFGVLIRFTALMGILMMVLYYLSAFPPEHGPIDQHIILIISFMVLALFGAGRIIGIDGFLEKQVYVIDKPWRRYLLG